MGLNPNRRRTRPGNEGSAKRIVIWVLVATSLFVAMATRMYIDGASDVGFVVVMAAAVVIAIAIVAPKRFTSVRGVNPEWEDDDPYGSDSESDDDKAGSDGSPNLGSRKGPA